MYRSMCTAVVVGMMACLPASHALGAKSYSNRTDHLTAAKTPAKAPAKSTGKADTYCVVQVGDEVSVARKSDVAGLRKSAAEEDKRAMKEYEAAKKEAKKNKEKFDTPKPTLRKVKILKDGFKTEQEAADWKDKRGEGKEDKPARKKSGNSY
jgi:hypothetical protein